MTLEPGTRLGPYEIDELRGKGGMGEVYRARDTRLDRDVAIKVLPSELSADETYRKRLDSLRVVHPPGSREFPAVGDLSSSSCAWRAAWCGSWSSQGSS